MNINDKLFRGGGGGGGGGSPLRWPNIRAGGGGGGGRPNDAYMSAACVKKYNFAVNLLCVSSNTFGRESVRETSNA